jgi:hypothetical protein
MRRARMRSVVAVLALIAGARSAHAACAKDTDCKGDRICQAGQCVYPSPTAPAAPVAGICTKDTECKGDRVCHEGQCKPPPAPGQPTPPGRPTPPVDQPAPVAPPTAPVQDATPAAPPTAEPPPPPAPEKAGARGSGISLAVRAGYAVPLGQAQQNDNLSDEVSGMIPFWFDAGYLFNPSFFVGLYFQYAPAITTTKTLSGACNGPGLSSGTEASCSAHDIRFGGEFHYHIAPKGPFDPWLGVGFGYEWATETISSNGKSVSQSGNGYEFINLQAGGDIKTKSGIGFGPFLALTVSQFGNYSDSSGGTSTSGSITDKTLHEWFFLGVRGVFDIYFH